MIATSVGGTPDLVSHSKTGLLVPPGDVTALSDAMRGLVEAPDLRDRMATAAMLKAREFTASAVVPRIERIYAEVLARRQASAKVCEAVMR